GESIDPQAALGIGLVSRVVAEDQAEAALDEALAPLRERSAAALRMVKRASLRARGATFREMVAPSEAVYLDELMATADALGHNVRRAVERGIPRRVRTIDYSNFTFALALQAGAQGVPFLPTRSVLGSDLPRTNPDLQPIDSPFGPDRLMAVRALVPDVAF